MVHNSWCWLESWLGGWFQSANKNFEASSCWISLSSKFFSGTSSFFDISTHWQQGENIGMKKQLHLSLLQTLFSKFSHCPRRRPTGLAKFCFLSLVSWLSLGWWMGKLSAACEVQIFNPGDQSSQAVLSIQHASHLYWLTCNTLESLKAWTRKTH